MKANDVVKGLECCIFDDCENCPHDEETACVENLHQESVDLIKSFKAEIKRLEANLKEALAEIEALKQINLHCKAETAKEFAERLKTEKATGMNWFGKEHYSVKIEDIDELVKEMVGASDG